MIHRGIFIILLWNILASGVGVLAAQTPGLDLCIHDFTDTNQNSQFDEGEPPFPGISVFVSRSSDGAVIGSLTTTPDRDCLLNLTPDTYDVTFSGNATHQPTTPTSVTVTLIDQTVTVDYGAITLTSDDPSPQLTESGSEICVLIFHDTNTNSQHDADEGLIGGIDVNLLVDDVIIATRITDNQDYSCFEGIPIGSYRVLIPESPRHRLTNRNDLALTFLDNAQSVKADFGAELHNPFFADARAQTYGRSEDQLNIDRDTRLLLAILGAGIVMLFMIGSGAILLGIMRR